MQSLARRLLLGSLALSAFACQNDFAPQSEVHGLRVLVVRPEPASGSPGANVHLELVFADSRPPGSMPAVSIAWLGGCHNPPSRQYYACLPALRRLAADPSLGGDPAALAEVRISSGPGATSFDEKLPDDVLSAAPKLPSDPLHYGVSYVFFAACLGTLSVDGASEFPLTCKNGDQSVGPSGFVIGFTTIYSYEGAENQNGNPALASVNFDGVPVFASSPDALGALPVVTDMGTGGTSNDGDADGGAGAPNGMNGAPSGVTPPDCTAEGGVTDGAATWLKCCHDDADCAGVAFSHGAACSDNHVCAPVIGACGGSACPALRVAPLLEPASMESAWGGNEVVWASYYATLGTFDNPARLVVDRMNGLAENYSAFWKPPPPDSSGARRTARLWTTLNDERGGATWGFFDVVVK
jgi:hypothetical protein